MQFLHIRIHEILAALVKGLDRGEIPEGVSGEEGRAHFFRVLRETHPDIPEDLPEEALAHIFELCLFAAGNPGKAFSGAFEVEAEAEAEENLSPPPYVFPPPGRRQ